MRPKGLKANRRRFFAAGRTPASQNDTLAEQLPALTNRGFFAQMGGSLHCAAARGVDPDRVRVSRQARQKTVLMVTHSISEALFLANRVLVLTQRPGSIKLDLKVDLPRPRNDEMRYTAHFGKLARRLKEAIG